MAQRTIFSFVIRQGEGIRSLSECRTLYRALAGHGAAGDLKPAAQACLIGQPVAAWARSVAVRPHFGSARARVSSRKRGRRAPTRPIVTCNAPSIDAGDCDRQSRILARRHGRARINGSISWIVRISRPPRALSERRPNWLCQVDDEWRSKAPTCARCATS